MNPTHDRCDHLGLTRTTLWDHIDAVGDMVSVDHMVLDTSTDIGVSEFLAVSVVRRGGKGTSTVFVTDPADARSMAATLIEWADAQEVRQ